MPPALLVGWSRPVPAGAGPCLSPLKTIAQWPGSRAGDVLKKGRQLVPLVSAIKVFDSQQLSLGYKIFI